MDKHKDHALLRHWAAGRHVFCRPSCVTEGHWGPQSQIWLLECGSCWTVVSQSWELENSGWGGGGFFWRGGGSRTAPLSAEGATLPLYVSPSWNKAGSWVHKSLQMALSDEAISIIMDSRQKAGPLCGLGALGPPPLLYSACGTGLTPVYALHCASAPILPHVPSVCIKSLEFCCIMCCLMLPRRCLLY